MRSTPGAASDSPEERVGRGREARSQVSPEAQAELLTTGRPDPVRMIAEQAVSRLPDLVPIRHARMRASPFAFYRGAAAVMAGDLARTPVSGIHTQLCGDAHLSNFGMFASPERNLLFDVNDFDETFAGPWEWDVKRLASSLVVAGRQNGFTPRQQRKAALAATLRYQDAMQTFAGMGNLAVWYSKVDVAEARRLLGAGLDDELTRRIDRAVAKARGRDHRRALLKLTEVVDGQRRIVSDPPLVIRLADLAPDLGPDEAEHAVRELLLGYSSSLPPGYRELARSYRFLDMARKVVGVGSVGTRCWIVLMQGRDDDDALFLQVKEAQPSVLARHVGGGRHRHEGSRVVAGQRVMQATGDVFLGWQRTVGLDGLTRDFYVRQLHDWKGSASVETMTSKGMRLYGQLCAWTLARAHARSGDRIAIAAYLGDDGAFAEAVADFAVAYADLNDRDFSAFSRAVDAGDLPALQV